MTEKHGLFQETIARFNKSQERMKARLAKLRTELGLDRFFNQPPTMGRIDRVMEGVGQTDADDREHADIIILVSRSPRRTTALVAEINRRYQAITTESVKRALRNDLLSFGYKFDQSGRVIANIGEPSDTAAGLTSGSAPAVELTQQIVPEESSTASSITDGKAERVDEVQSRETVIVSTLKEKITELAALLRRHTQAPVENYEDQLKIYIKHISTLVVGLELELGQQLTPDTVSELMAPLAPFVDQVQRRGKPVAVFTPTTNETAAAAGIGFAAMAGGGAEAQGAQAQIRFDRALRLAKELRDTPDGVEADRILNDIKSDLQISIGIYPGNITREDALRLSQRTFNLSRQLRSVLLQLYSL